MKSIHVYLKKILLSLQIFYLTGVCYSLVDLWIVVFAVGWLDVVDVAVVVVGEVSPEWVFAPMSNLQRFRIR